MALLASDVLTRARSTLLDASAVSWSDAELISYLNGGVTQVVNLKPDAYPKVATLTLAAAVQQTLPADGVLFLDCLYNASGGAVTQQPMHEFIRVRPTWAADTPGPTVYVLFDPRLPKVFHVYPKAVASAQLTVMYGAMPTRVGATSDPIGLPDWYETALWAFVCATAYAKNSKRQDFTKSDEMMKIFTQSVVGDTQAERMTAPKADLAGVV